MNFSGYKDEMYFLIFESDTNIFYRNIMFYVVNKFKWITLRKLIKFGKFSK